MTYPATNFEEAVSNTITSSDQLHQVINGGVTDTIATESGEIPSVRKALIDNMYFVEAIPWVQGDNETVFNQLRTFTDNAVYWAPNATVSNPVPMGVTPEADSNWTLAPVSLTEGKIRQVAFEVWNVGLFKDLLSKDMSSYLTFTTQGHSELGVGEAEYFRTGNIGTPSTGSESIFYDSQGYEFRLNSNPITPFMFGAEESPNWPTTKVDAGPALQLMQDHSQEYCSWVDWGCWNGYSAQGLEMSERLNAMSDGGFLHCDNDLVALQPPRVSTSDAGLLTLIVNRRHSREAYSNPSVFQLLNFNCDTIDNLTGARLVTLNNCKNFVIDGGDYVVREGTGAPEQATANTIFWIRGFVKNGKFLNKPNLQNLNPSAEGGSLWIQGLGTLTTGFFQENIDIGSVNITHKTGDEAIGIFGGEVDTRNIFGQFPNITIPSDANSFAKALTVFTSGTAFSPNLTSMENINLGTVTIDTSVATTDIVRFGSDSTNEDLTTITNLNAHFVINCRGVSCSPKYVVRREKVKLVADTVTAKISLLDGADPLRGVSSITNITKAEFNVSGGEFSQGAIHNVAAVSGVHINGGYVEIGVQYNGAACNVSNCVKLNARKPIVFISGNCVASNNQGVLDPDVDGAAFTIGQNLGDISFNAYNNQFTMSRPLHVPFDWADISSVGVHSMKGNDFKGSGYQGHRSANGAGFIEGIRSSTDNTFYGLLDIYHVFAGGAANINVSRGMHRYATMIETSDTGGVSQKWFMLDTPHLGTFKANVQFG